jgi:hypothetical protein
MPLGGIGIPGAIPVGGRIPVGGGGMPGTIPVGGRAAIMPAETAAAYAVEPSMIPLACWRALDSSRQEEKRALGSFAIARRITCSTAGGMPGFTADGGGGCSVRILTSTPVGLSACTGKRPVSAS